MSTSKVPSKCIPASSVAVIVWRSRSTDRATAGQVAAQLEVRPRQGCEGDFVRRQCTSEEADAPTGANDGRQQPAPPARGNVELVDLPLDVLDAVR
jgi:hypothetical protein